MNVTVTRILEVGEDHALAEATTSEGSTVTFRVTEKVDLFVDTVENPRMTVYVDLDDEDHPDRITVLPKGELAADGPVEEG